MLVFFLTNIEMPKSLIYLLHSLGHSFGAAGAEQFAIAHSSSLLHSKIDEIRRYKYLHYRKFFK